MTARLTGYALDPVTMAGRLLGQRLVRVLDGERLAGRIVEVEAYLGARDRAAHTCGGRRTARNASMYLPGGHAYVYFTYGMHHCLNVVCGRKGEGVAVLIRALEPTEGLAAMYARRPSARRPADLCSGPGKLTAALGLDRRHDGLDLKTSPDLFVEPCRGTIEVVRTRRIGVGYAGLWAARRLRFLIKGSPHVSRR